MCSKLTFWAKRALASPPGACPMGNAHHEQHENIVSLVSCHDGGKNWRICTKNYFGPKTALLGPKRDTLGNRGREMTRRAAKRPPTRKPKVSRVTSGYVGLMIPLSQVRLTPKMTKFDYICKICFFLRYTHITPLFLGQTVPTQLDHKSTIS